MFALAQFVLAGRIKAALVAFFGNLLPLVSPAAVGLVSLRHGVREGLLILLWALLPLLVVLNVTAPNATEVMVIWALAVAVGLVMMGAVALRSNAGWSRTLVAMVFCTVLVTFVLNALLPDRVTGMHAELTAFLTAAASKQEHAIASMPGEVFVTGLIASIMILTASASLLLARWWQALLYGPGEFQREFHALRLSKLSAVVLMVGVVICFTGSADYLTWVNVIGLPLLLSGIALIHHTVAVAQLGGHWLVIFYVGLLLGPLSTLLVGLGFLDSMLDLRARLAARKNRHNP